MASRSHHVSPATFNRSGLKGAKATTASTRQGQNLSATGQVPTPPGTRGATPRVPPPKLESVIALMNDPSTADQHERQSEQLLAALEAYGQGFTPSVAIDAVPQIMSFLVNELKKGEELNEQSTTSLIAALSAILQYIAYPIRCTTLDDQRKHDAGLRSLLDASCLALDLPQPTMRIATLIVQRQIFSFIRQQCNDDMSPATVAFHKKKEFQRSISNNVVDSLLRTWQSAFDDEQADSGASGAQDDVSDSDDEEIEVAVDAARTPGSDTSSRNASHQQQQQQTVHTQQRPQRVGDSDSDDDSPPQAASMTPASNKKHLSSSPAGASGMLNSTTGKSTTNSNQLPNGTVYRGATEQRNCGPELVAVVKAVQELSYYKSLSHILIESGVTPLIFSTMARCAAGERCLTLTVELLWNLLSLDPDAAEVMGCQENLDVIENCFTQTLQLGYMLKDRELRNDLIIVCKLLANYEPNIPYFYKLLPLLLDLSCGSEKAGNTQVVEAPSPVSATQGTKDPLRVNPLVDPTYHYTTRIEELQMKKLCWDLIDQFCCNEDFAKRILDWGFIGSIISYIDVRCEIPAVVRWTTLQLLDLQAASLRTLSSIAVIGADYFSAAGGADIVHEYIAECPDVQLRNLGVSVLAQTATTHRRRELVEAGSIPLSLALLRDTGDNALRVECLNLLADVVDRSEDLQEVFLECDGVRTVLPLMTLNPDYYTELLDTVTFASVDCIWSCAFGRDENEESFLHQGGLSSLLQVIETCNPWMLSFPLSCLADFLQSPAAVQLFRQWESGKTGRTATQLLISFWKMELENKEQSTSGQKMSGLSTIGTSKMAHLKPRPGDEPAGATIEEFEVQEHQSCLNAKERAATIERIGLEKVPEDIKFLVNENSIQFKIHVAMSLVGFDDHKELDDMERGTLVAIERFTDLCKDEIWNSVASSLEENGIRPTSPDAEKLRLLRIAAESRSQQLEEAHTKHKNRHEVRQAESEVTFYKSLIKKTEEKRVGPRKAVGLSITEAKIRKAQMLKQSFKHALSKQGAGKSGNGPSEEELAAEAMRQQQEEEEREQESAGADTTAQRLERWGPGQRAMTDTEYGILQALNNIRTNPLSLIPLMEEKLKFLNEAGNAFHVPNRDPETCIEGAAVYHEAIDYIKTVRPLVTLLDVPMGLLFAARDHVSDLSRRMEVSQDGADGSNPHARIQRYGKLGTQKYSQLLALATNDPVEMLMALIVNDGVKSRIDRKTIFDPDMRLAGISTGPHSIHETVTCFILCQEYVELPAVEQRKAHAGVSQAAKQRAQQG